MTVQRGQTVISLKAGEASMPAGRVVVLGSANSVLMPTTNLASKLLGITINSASLTGQAVSVAIAGTAKAQAGTNLTTGDLVSFQTLTGLLLSTTALDKTKSSVLRPLIGMVMASGSKSTMVEILLNIQYRNKTAYS